MALRPCIGCRALIPSGSYCGPCKAQRFPSSPGRLRGKEWMKRRGQVLRAHDWRCAECGTFSVPLEVHHRDHDATNNTFRNLIPLCRPCHAKAGVHRESINAP